MNYFYLSLIAFLLISCSKNDPFDSSGTIPVSTKTVKYKISCHDCFVFWLNESGFSESSYNQNSDWEYSFEGHSGDRVEVGVMNSEGNLGYNSVYIYLNNKLLESSNSSCPINGAAFVSDTLN